MSDPFVGEVQAVGFNFAPKGWALCQGQLLALSQNTALFSLLGTYYGGDGKTTFALPNLQSFIAIGQGQSAGTSDYVIGETAGNENITLLISEIPNHTHTLESDNFGADGSTPSPSACVDSTSGNSIYNNQLINQVIANPSAISVAGGSQPHNNMMPYQVINWIIAMQGVYPPRG